MGPVRVDVIVEDVIATHRQQANQHQHCYKFNLFHSQSAFI
jgi:hypothetical protein